MAVVPNETNTIERVELFGLTRVSISMSLSNRQVWYYFLCLLAPSSLSLSLSLFVSLSVSLCLSLSLSFALFLSLSLSLCLSLSLSVSLSFSLPTVLCQQLQPQGRCFSRSCSFEQIVIFLANIQWIVEFPFSVLRWLTIPPCCHVRKGSGVFVTTNCLVPSFQEWEMVRLAQTVCSDIPCSSCPATSCGNNWMGCIHT